MPIDRQQQAHGQLGDGDGVLAGDVGDVDSPIRCGRLVDVVGSSTGPDDQTQAGAGPDRLGSDLGRSNHENLDVAVMQSSGKRLGTELGGDLDLVSGFSQGL